MMLLLTRNFPSFCTLRNVDLSPLFLERSNQISPIIDKQCQTGIELFGRKGKSIKMPFSRCVHVGETINYEEGSALYFADVGVLHQPVGQI